MFARATSIENEKINRISEATKRSKKKLKFGNSDREPLGEIPDFEAPETHFRLNKNGAYSIQILIWLLYTSLTGWSEVARTENEKEGGT